MHYAEGSMFPVLFTGLLTDSIRHAPVPFFIKPVTGKVAGNIEGACKFTICPNVLKPTVMMLSTQPACSERLSDECRYQPRTQGALHFLGGVPSKVPRERRVLSRFKTFSCRFHDVFRPRSRRATWITQRSYLSEIVQLCAKNASTGCVQASRGEGHQSQR